MSKGKKQKIPEEPFNLNKSLQNYATYDDYIRKYKPKISSVEKMLNKEKKAIIKYASSHKISKKDFPIEQSIISIQTEKKLSSFNQKFVKECLGKYFIQKYPNMNKKKCVSIAENIMNFMLKQRTSNDQIKLSRQIPNN